MRGNDRFGNPTPVDKTGLTLDADPSINIDLSTTNGRATWINGVILNAIGVHRLALKDGEKTLAISNPIVAEHVYPINPLTKIPKSGAYL